VISNLREKDIIKMTGGKEKAQAVPGVEALIGYRFNNQEICWEALQGKQTSGYPNGNKRLALLGDALLRVRLVKDWFPTGQSPSTRLYLDIRENLY
jgi:hypothetical protein